MDKNFLDLVINESLSTRPNDQLFVSYTSNNAAEAALNHLVLDYLYKNGYQRTCALLKAEARIENNNISYRSLMVEAWTEFWNKFTLKAINEPQENSFESYALNYIKNKEKRPLTEQHFISRLINNNNIHTVNSNSNNNTNNNNNNNNNNLRGLNEESNIKKQIKKNSSRPTLKEIFRKSRNKLRQNNHNNMNTQKLLNSGFEDPNLDFDHPDNELLNLRMGDDTSSLHQNNIIRGYDGTVYDTNIQQNHSKLS